MAGNDIYEKFIRWLGGTWWGLPESEHLRPTIEAFYSEDEAENMPSYAPGRSHLMVAGQFPVFCHIMPQP